MEKSKTGQKGAGKQQQQQQQQRPGTEQQRSGTHIQKGEGERIQVPKSGEQLKHTQGKTSKKVGGTGS